MEYPIHREHRRFGLALAASLALHAVVLYLKPAASIDAVRHQAAHRASRLDVELQQQAISPPAATSAAAKPHERRARVLTARPDKSPSMAPEPTPSWTQAERDEINQFLGELAAQARPRTGRDLAQRALAMAGTMAAPEQQDDELKEMTQKFAAAQVDPFSVEMYFDSLFRKMNRSAAMVTNQQRTKGRHIAAVRVVIDKDGSVKNFRVLWAADQQVEIAFIKAVVDQAAPFPAFPPDIRKATDSVVLQICIMPDSYGGGGATFTRMSQGQTCQEPR